MKLLNTMKNDSVEGKHLSLFGAKTPFSNLSGLMWAGPKQRLQKDSLRLVRINRDL